MGLLQDLDRFNRKIFSQWSFINNRKLLLLWCNGIVIFYLLDLTFPHFGYGILTLILALLFLIIEMGEFLSKKKPKTESESNGGESKPDTPKVRTVRLRNTMISIWKIKPDDKSESNK